LSSLLKFDHNKKNRSELKLQGTILKGTILKGINLKGINLKGINLKGINPDLK